VDWIGRWHKRGYDYYSGITSRKYPRAFSLASKLNEITRMARLPFRLFSLPRIRGDFVTQEATELIEKAQDDPFFLFVHYWDTHTPYDPPKPFLKPFQNFDYGDNRNVSGVLAELRHKSSWQMKKRAMPPGVKTVNHILQRYDGAIAFVDYEVGKLIKTLDSTGVLDDTLLIFTADHGESLTEHGIYWTHHGLYDVTIKVPLILSHSGLPKNRRVKALVQHTDLVPTILEAAGVESVVPIDGKSLMPLMSNNARPVHSAVFAEEEGLQRKRGIRTRDFKYICAESAKDAICRECGCVHGGLEELYDLRKDPGEDNNIVDENPDVRAKLRKELATWVALCVSRRAQYSVRNGGRTAEPYPTGEEEEIRKRLSELGYF
jgi:arylsulfatase A-like enzyme